MVVTGSVRSTRHSISAGAATFPTVSCAVSVNATLSSLSNGPTTSSADVGVSMSSGANTADTVGCPDTCNTYEKLHLTCSLRH